MPIYEHDTFETKPVSGQEIADKLGQIARIKNTLILVRGAERRSPVSWARCNGILLERIPSRFALPVCFSWTGTMRVQNGLGSEDFTARTQHLLFLPGMVIQPVPKVIHAERGSMTTHVLREIGWKEFLSFTRVRPSFAEYVMLHADGFLHELRRASRLAVVRLESKLYPIEAHPSSAEASADQ